ncbi:class I SAM-dependent methyltransferase [Serinibacter salmoneus]|uniref:class I SAM-dependent methyltransferase n=1 Tax=Serinibacter salmoneus TaxID=556530 RepID=UPI003183BC1E
MNSSDPVGEAPDDPTLPALAWAGYEEPPGSTEGTVDDALTARRWWDANATEYLADHATDLGVADFTWGPEGLREADARLLGDVRGRRILEIGAGSAPCSAWLADHGAEVIASDISHPMLAAGRAARGRAKEGEVDIPLVQADARHLPFAANTVDVVFTSYGVIPFVADLGAVHREVARVLRPGGRWVFSTTHPVRWAFPDDPGPEGLTARRSYYDDRPYRERAEDGEALYSEYHRTLEQHVALLVAAGFAVVDLREPRWQPGRRTWGGWSELRGRTLPGTLILSARRLVDG